MEQVTLDLSDPRQAHKDQRLHDDLIIWFTSVRPDGRPHIVPVWFWWDKGIVWVFSVPGQKIRDIQHNPTVMLALDNTNGGGDLVILEGRAELLPDSDLSMATPAYVEKYGALIARMGYAPEQIAQRYNHVIRVTPVRFL
jgi:PPOX class probable F420-dependent enzyme